MKIARQLLINFCWIVAAAALAPVSASAASCEDTQFAVCVWDMQANVDAAGTTAFTQASGHPYSITSQIRLTTRTDPVNGPHWPSEAIKDALGDLPPGLVGNPNVLGKCTLSQLTDPEGKPTCPASSQVGMINLSLSPATEPSTSLFPLYSMVAPAGVPARFGFTALGTVVTLNARLRSGGDYGLSVDSKYISEGLPFTGIDLTFWGVPADPVHTPERSCPGEFPPLSGGPSCEAGITPAGFIRLPTSCPEAGQGLVATLHASSWKNPGTYNPDGSPDLGDPAWKSAATESHLPPGLATEPDPSGWGAPQGPTGCDSVPFEPTISVQPTTEAADSPTGLDITLQLPQFTDPEAISEADLKRAVVTLPQGMAVNPASVSGLGGCSPVEIDLHGENTAPSCPESSKIGSVELTTPLLSQQLEGSVYVAEPGDNPFGSLLALYIVAKGPGIFVKLPGEVKTDADTGQLQAVFDDNPQLPFSELDLHLKSGPRAPLLTPDACGRFATEAGLNSWSRPDEASPTTDSFEVTSGPNGSPCPSHPAGFDPKLSAGVLNSVAGDFSPFALKLSRDDGTQRLASLQVSPPRGLLASLRDLPYCPDAVLTAIPGGKGTGAVQFASPSCPSASEVGGVAVGAGAGSNPFYLDTGRVYLAGPYKGAPLSLAIVTPAVAGPFDLGNVVVRTALRIDPESAQITAVSDPLPSILHGIPLDLRDIRVNLDRPNFTINPTDCEPLSIDATIAGAEGASAQRSVPFQVANCAALPFKPKLALKLSGATHRSAHPALRATLTMRPGGANVARAQVTLPKTEFLDQAHIRTICTRVQYAAGGGGGAQCPAGSVYGHARAFTPLLDQPLEGPVYLRSSDHELPDLVASLGGQIHIDLVGRIDSVKGRLRNTFEAVPDAPVTKFVLQMQGGRKGLLVNNTELCRAKPRATARFDGQNGKLGDSRPPVKADCGKGQKKARR